MKELLPALIGAFVRAALQIAAGAGLAVAPDMETQITLGLVAVGTLIWSALQKKGVKINPKLLALFFVTGLSLSVTACAGRSQEDCMKQVAATEIAITEGYETTAHLLVGGVIDKGKAKKALVALDAANAAVDNAAPLCKLGIPKASDYLRQAALALVQFTTLTGGKP